jgi:1,4-alpha-glucan branching enzyme
MAKSSSPKRRTTFVFVAPAAQQVELLGDFTDWDKAPLPLRKGKAGRWSKVISLAPGRYEYRYRVDGEWLNDPECLHRMPNAFGGENCVCVVD